MSDIHQSGFVEPSIDADSQPWWDALGEHRLLLPRCNVCGRHWFPPTPGCPNCGANDFAFVEASGRGTLYSWVVIQRALHPEFARDVPYTIALVELEEGPRLFGRLFANGSPLDMAAGMLLQSVFYTVQDRTLLGFQPA
jgi:uncharacterized OB-fold protein